jgi:hypothetical protein
VIVALPEPTAVTTPDAETVAVPVAELCHVAEAVTSCFDPSEKLAVAVNCPCCPDVVKLEGPEIVTDVSVAPDGDVGESFFLEHPVTREASTNATSATRNARAIVDSPWEDGLSAGEECPTARILDLRRPETKR